MKTKAVIFDFDGTLTTSNDDIWEKLYHKIGMSTDINSNYCLFYKKFKSGEFDYFQWCDACVQDYINVGLTKALFESAASEISLLSDAEEVFKFFHDNGIKLYVLSGNIAEAIKFILGDNLKYFEDICANEFYFEANGSLNHVITTKYDFEKKADYVLKIKEELNVQVNEICFIGNGENDVYVHKSGATTICINPINADEENKNKWDYVVKDTKNLKDILKYIN